VDWILKALQDADRENDQKRQEARQRLERDKRELDRKLDVLYEDKLSGSIDEDFWKRKQQEYRTRLSWIEDNLQRGEQDSGERLANAERIIELSQKAYSLYLTQDMDEKRKLLDLLLLNSTMKDRKVESTLRHPFDIIADGAIEEEQMRHKKRPEKAINENWLPDRYLYRKLILPRSYPAVSRKSGRPKGPGSRRRRARPHSESCHQRHPAGAQAHGCLHSAMWWQP